MIGVLLNNEEGNYMNHNAHYFWAVRIPDQVKQTIYDELNKLQNIFQFKRWVHMDDYHITLAFLGSVEEEKLQTAIELVEAAIQQKETFPLEIHGLNIFGNKKSPRIFWGAVHQQEKLFQLQEIVHKKCLEAGFTLEDRAYHPHITFARNWAGSEEFTMAFLEEYNPFQNHSLSFQVNEVVLYRTNLEKTPKYEPIVTFPMVNNAE